MDFLKNIQKEAADNGVAIGAYCLMDNHFHLMAYPDSENGLIRFVKLLSQTHTQRVNKKYGRTGKLWENRYKMNIVDPESEWVVARYIERNPVRAGMTAKAEDYKFSSAGFSIRGENDSIITKDIICGRRKEYLEAFNRCDDAKESAELRKTLLQGKIYGKDKFIEEIEKIVGRPLRIQNRGRPIVKQV